MLYFGGDNCRTAYHCKDKGTLTFSGGEMRNISSMKLIKINPDSNETGYIH